jgi:hypothetical protein
MQGVSATGHAPHVLAVSSPMAQQVGPLRHRCTASESRQSRRARSQEWEEITCTTLVASEPTRPEGGPLVPCCWLWTRSPRIRYKSFPEARPCVRSYGTIV